MTVTTVHSIFIIVALLQGQSAQSVSADKGEFTFQISMKDSQLSVGAEARVSVVVTNVSDHAIAVVHRLKLGEGRTGEGSFAVYVRDMEGHLVPETKYGHKLRTGEDPPGEPMMGVSGSASLGGIPPGEADKSAVTLNNLYDLTQPGTYTVQVQRLDKNKVLVKSNTLTFTMVAAR
jgi:hypothetical protein